MKKQLLVNTLTMGIVLLIASGAYSQEMLVDGNMEKGDGWSTMYVDGTTVPAELVFNYSDDAPLYGQGACLQVNVSTGSQEYAQLVIYQSVDLKANVEYELKGAFKAAETMVDYFWCEVSVSGYPVEEGSDFKPDSVNVRYAYYNDWDECDNDIDGPFGDFCSGTQDDIVVFDKDTTVNFAVKMGLWNKEISYNVLLDEFSLKGPGTGTALNRTSTNEISVYPNPATDLIQFEGVLDNSSMKLVDMSGRTVLQKNLLNRPVDISELSKGLYTVIVSNQNGVYTSQVVKQ